jgi:hypothetical protein
MGSPQTGLRLWEVEAEDLLRFPAARNINPNQHKSRPPPKAGSRTASHRKAILTSERAEVTLTSKHVSRRLSPRSSNDRVRPPSPRQRRSSAGRPGIPRNSANQSPIALRATRTQPDCPPKQSVPVCPAHGAGRTCLMPIQPTCLGQSGRHPHCSAPDRPGRICILPRHHTRSEARRSPLRPRQFPRSTGRLLCCTHQLPNRRATQAGYPRVPLRRSLRP